jgi:hypothetical protein
MRRLGRLWCDPFETHRPIMWSLMGSPISHGWADTVVILHILVLDGWADCLADSVFSYQTSGPTLL